MSANQVTVKNISSETSDKEIREFFSFCGKISNINVKPFSDSTKEAEVTFEKETAAKTALLLDHTRLGSHEVQVTSPHADKETVESASPRNEGDEITQEEKPRARIIAEYLAHGYVIKDQGIQKAIDLDNKHGVSQRFLGTLQSFDSKYHATDKAKSVDQSYGVSQKANNLLSGLTSYYEKAVGTPSGQKLVNFYTSSSKQVLDIHNEATRLASLKKKDAAGTPEKVADGKTVCKCDKTAEGCPCAENECFCAGCAKSNNKLEKKADGKTSCACSGNLQSCLCKAGECTCGSCPKATLEKVDAKHTKCACGGNEGVCACKTGECTCSSCPKSTKS